ncbi:conserved exported hypothetical protein [Tenacibaculum litopenaei]|uniref:hypothetical protein n=1 Tax=Tenacibaculum litopenaei TaxID=396016 RepID=UPI003893FBEF
MKKTTYFLLVVLAMCFTAVSAQKSSGFDKITYKAETRGTQVQITLEGDEVVFNRNGQQKKYQVSYVRKAKIQKLLSEVSLNALKTLEVPSNKRSSDAALQARLEIEQRGVRYTSPTFDEGNPPTKIKELVHLLLDLSKPE